MTSLDGVYWALAVATLIIAAGLTWLLVRMAGTVGRVNRVIADAAKEVPAAAAGVRKILDNAEEITANVAAATRVINDGAAALKLLITRVREAVAFLDEHIFSRLAALAPVLTAVGASLGFFTRSRAARAERAEKAGAPADEENDTATEDKKE
jgi:hypothetical protein